jgi:hypothetical protein
MRHGGTVPTGTLRISVSWTEVPLVLGVVTLSAKVTAQQRTENEVTGMSGSVTRFTLDGWAIKEWMFERGMSYVNHVSCDTSMEESVLTTETCVVCGKTMPPQIVALWKMLNYNRLQAVKGGNDRMYAP